MTIDRSRRFASSLAALLGVALLAVTGAPPTHSPRRSPRRRHSPRRRLPTSRPPRRMPHRMPRRMPRAQRHRWRARNPPGRSDPASLDDPAGGTTATTWSASGAIRTCPPASMPTPSCRSSGPRPVRARRARWSRFSAPRGSADRCGRVRLPSSATRSSTARFTAMWSPCWVMSNWDPTRTSRAMWSRSAAR